MKNVKTAIIAANNHYAGFGPMTAKLFAEMMNLQNKAISSSVNNGSLHNEHFNSVPLLESENPLVSFIFF
jgi:hypothetical protein